MSENVHSGHRERMRKKILTYGAKSLEDHELLEVLLYYCIPQRNTNPLAHKIINEYGSLLNLMDANVHDLIKRCKLSERTAILINLIPEFVSRYSAQKWDKDKLNLLDIDTVGEYAKSLLSTQKKELFYMFCLDTQGNLIKSELVSEGEVNETDVNLRRIAELALKNNTSSVILAHNHPGGSFMVSNSDINATSRIIHALELMNITVYDHIIVVHNSYISFVKVGLMYNGRPTKISMNYEKVKEIDFAAKMNS